MAIGRAVVYHARAAHAFSAGINYRHCASGLVPESGSFTNLRFTLVSSTITNYVVKIKPKYNRQLTINENPNHQILQSKHLIPAPIERAYAIARLYNNTHSKSENKPRTLMPHVHVHIHSLQIKATVQL